MAGRQRRGTGSVEKLPSGNYRAIVWDPVEGRRERLGTFPTREAAETAIALALADSARGVWAPPSAGKIAFETYATQWVAAHPGLTRSTRGLYERLLRAYLLPAFEGAALRDISPVAVRTWYAQFPSSEGQRAKAYRLLRAILNAAIEDQLLAVNPAKIKGGGLEPESERPMVPIPQVFALADAINPRYRVLLLVAAFASMR